MQRFRFGYHFKSSKLRKSERDRNLISFMVVKIRLFNYIQIRLRARLKSSQITFNNDASTHVCSNIIASVRAVPPRGHDNRRGAWGDPSWPTSFSLIQRVCRRPPPTSRTPARKFVRNTGCRQQCRGPEVPGGDALAVVGVRVRAGRDLLADLACALFRLHSMGRN